MGIRTQSPRAATPGGRPPAGPAARLRDRFELLAPLGRGGFGTVWEGFDMLLERPVAVKELTVSGDLTDAGDALREARATARLNHPAIVALYEMIAEPDRVYMISELVHGVTLDELLDEGMLSDEDCGRIGVALCEALAHAHAYGVVHRDVKPANVMVTAEWIDGVSGWRAQPAKLMDFGIASIVDAGERGTGPHAGSRGYVAPEQAAGAPATPASDVYSLALVLYECFNGAPPRRAGARLGRRRRDLPAELTGVVDDCLASDPASRPELGVLAAELASALPLLSDELNSRGLLARLRRAGRGHGISADVESGRTGRTARRSGPRDAPRVTADGDRATPPRLRAASGLAAATVAALTALVVHPPPSAPTVALAGALAVALPRAGWPIGLLAGAAVLAAGGEYGCALLLSPAAVAWAVAVLTLPRSRLVSGSLWGAGAFVWLMALQAASGEPLLLSPKVGSTVAPAAGAGLGAALKALALFARPAYAASLALWAVAGALAVLLWQRRARMFIWSCATAAAIAGQVMTAAALHAMVPPVTLVCAPLAATSTLLLAAAVGRRAGRVFRAS